MLDSNIAEYQGTLKYGCKIIAQDNVLFLLLNQYNYSLFSSNDKGLSWTNIVNKKYINNVCPVSTNTIFAVGSRTDYEGAIFRTDDFGSSFDILSTVDHSDSRNKQFNSISFSNKSTAWVVGDSGLLLKSIDSGLTWNRQRNLTSENLSKVKFIDSNIGWISGGNKIFLTYDGGLTWKDKSIVTSTPVRDVFCSDEQNCWAVGDDGLILHLTNKLENIIILTSPEKNRSFKCGDSLTVRWRFDGVSKLSILLSYDGGEHYTMYKNLIDNDGEEVILVSANAVTSNSCKVKMLSSDGKISGESEYFSIVSSSGVLNNNKITNQKISIRKNYVTLSLKQHEKARLRVFNVAGKVVYSKTVSSDGNKVINEIIPSDMIKHGCYIIQIKAGSETLTERIFIGNQK